MPKSFERLRIFRKISHRSQFFRKISVRNFFRKISYIFFADVQDQRGEGFLIIYTQERLKKQFETFNNQSKKEIRRAANLYKKEKGKELTIYNCFDYYLYIFLYDKIITIDNYLTKIESKELTKEEIIDYQKKYLRVIWYTLNYIKPESKL